MHPIPNPQAMQTLAEVLAIVAAAILAQRIAGANVPMSPLARPWPTCPCTGECVTDCPHHIPSDN